MANGSADIRLEAAWPATEAQLTAQGQRVVYNTQMCVSCLISPRRLRRPLDSLSQQHVHISYVLPNCTLAIGHIYIPFRYFNFLTCCYPPFPFFPFILSSAALTFPRVPFLLCPLFLVLYLLYHSYLSAFLHTCCSSLHVILFFQPPPHALIFCPSLFRTRSFSPSEFCPSGLPVLFS